MLLKNCEPWMPHGSRPAGAIVDTIVLHCSGHAPGTKFANLVKYMQGTKGAAAVSYHVLLDKSGNGVKGVPYAKRAFHAGSSYGPREVINGVSRAQKADKKFAAGCSVNDYSVGISFFNLNLLEGKAPVEPYTDAQLDSALTIIEALKVQFPGLKWITTHAEVSPRRKTDPVGFDLGGFAKRAQLTPWRFKA